jgi:hypothetical protein
VIVFRKGLNGLFDDMLELDREKLAKELEQENMADTISLVVSLSNEVAC